MTCFLGSDVMRSYIRILSLDPGWRDEMQRWRMTLALVLPESRLAAALRESGDWNTLYEDETAILLQRRTDWEVAMIPQEYRTAIGAGQASR
jgi:hypothetical protein